MDRLRVQAAANRTQAAGWLHLLPGGVGSPLAAAADLAARVASSDQIRDQRLNRGRGGELCLCLVLASHAEPVSFRAEIHHQDEDVISEMVTHRSDLGRRADAPAGCHVLSPGSFRFIFLCAPRIWQSPTISPPCRSSHPDTPTPRRQHICLLRFNSLTYYSASRSASGSCNRPLLAVSQNCLGKGDFVVTYYEP